MSDGTAVIVTNHFYNQGRRGSMHWLADELVLQGWQVRFVTFGYSRVSQLVGDVRLKALAAPPRDGRYTAAPGIEQIFHTSLFHPIDLRSRLANALAGPLFRLFPRLWRKHLAEAAAGADLIVLESGLPLMLAPIVRRISKAKLVYRVNDDIRVMRAPPMLRALEMQYASLFDRVSVASPVLAERFRATASVGIDPMGLDRSAFEEPHADPFGPRWEREVVCAGTSHFDAAAVLALATERPDWRFHVIGRLRAPIAAPNIVSHGELPFRQVVPMVQHADIGLAPYQDVPGVEYQAHHSNRLQQYAYCRLPTLAPARMLNADAPYLIGYDRDDRVSILAALDVAERFDRASLTGEVFAWKALCDGILEVMA